ncbi:hypothetical protein [Flavobacterium pallidum]|uniref:Uncharacterized protein n=1 Tax=Flavobacterium pallidum TaxID=2172098 RepID=A0A2S1SKD1_9FLAO|nr:hypothetical protein [Flavobacterium pallidum]AWI26831.1 hypothetical protein HYN49_13500 [Flavobacterium pallidum]
MQKIINSDKGNFVIGYCDNLEELEMYQSNYLTEAFRIEFKPNCIMTEEMVKDYTSNFVNFLKTEVLELAKIHSDFYDHFEISFANEFTGFSLGRKENYSELIVSISSMNVFTKIKEVSVN